MEEERKKVNEIVGLYLQGLFWSFCFISLLLFLGWPYRAYQSRGKTKRERQADLYESLLIALVTIPVLAFAFLSLLVMLKA